MKLHVVWLALLCGCVVAERRRYPVEAPLSALEVRDMARQGVSDEVMIAKIRSAGVSHSLSPSDLASLRDGGVSDRVVEEMIMAGVRTQERTAYVHYYSTPAIWYWGPWSVFWWHGGWYWHHGHHRHWGWR
jgi:hypothetical protein